MEVFIEDYREFDGVWLPTKSHRRSRDLTERWARGPRSGRTAHIEHNEKVAASLFKKPEELEADWARRVTGPRSSPRWLPFAITRSPALLVGARRASRQELRAGLDLPVVLPQHDFEGRASAVPAASTAFAATTRTKQKGGFRIDDLSADFTRTDAAVDRWREVIERSSMPVKCRLRKRSPSAPRHGRERGSQSLGWPHAHRRRRTAERARAARARVLPAPDA